MKINVIAGKNIKSLLESDTVESLESQFRNCVARTIEVLRDNQLTVGFAESCTGGLLSSVFTQVPGVSEFFLGSVVSYANSVKQDILGVEETVLKNYGAVSAECAQQMSEGVLKRLKAKCTLAITGIAGPGGGTKEKPVGTVYIAVSGINTASPIPSTLIFHHDFGMQNRREDIQKLAAIAALENLEYFVRNKLNKD